MRSVRRVRPQESAGPAKRLKSFCMRASSQEEPGLGPVSGTGTAACAPSGHRRCLRAVHPLPCLPHPFMHAPPWPLLFAFRPCREFATQMETHTLDLSEEDQLQIALALSAEEQQLGAAAVEDERLARQLQVGGPCRAKSRRMYAEQERTVDVQIVPCRAQSRCLQSKQWVLRSCLAEQRADVCRASSSCSDTCSACWRSSHAHSAPLGTVGSRVILSGCQVTRASFPRHFSLYSLCLP